MTATEASSRRPVREYAVWIALGVLAIAGIATWATSAQALSTDHATARVVAGSGDIIHVGHAGLVTRHVVVRDVGAPTTNVFDVELSVCEPRPDDAVLGVGRDDDLARHCASLEPVTRGTHLPVREPGDAGPYVVSTLTFRSSDVAVFCGFDLSYRSGWRLGRQEQVGSYRVVVNGDRSVAEVLCQ